MDNTEMNTTELDEKLGEIQQTMCNLVNSITAAEQRKVLLKAIKDARMVVDKILDFAVKSIEEL